MPQKCLFQGTSAIAVTASAGGLATDVSDTASSTSRRSNRSRCPAPSTQSARVLPQIGCSPSPLTRRSSTSYGLVREQGGDEVDAAVVAGMRLRASGLSMRRAARSSDAPYSSLQGAIAALKGNVGGMLSVPPCRLKSRWPSRCASPRITSWPSLVQMDGARRGMHGAGHTARDVRRGMLGVGRTAWDASTAWEARRGMHCAARAARRRQPGTGG